MSDLATIDAPPELRESVAACVKWSQDNAIATADDFTDTAEHLKQIKSRQKQADEFFDEPINQAYQLHKTLVGRKKLVTDPLQQSERIDKTKMLAYQKAEEYAADLERRRLQAIADEKARVERQKAEQEAAKQRVIEAQAKADADAARQLAEQASAAERKKLLAEAEASDRKAAAAAVKVEARTEQAAQATAPVIHVASNAPKVSGIATKKVWTFQVINPDLIPREFLIVDEKKLAGYARAMREGANVAGVRFFAEDSLSSRGA